MNVRLLTRSSLVVIFSLFLLSSSTSQVYNYLGTFPGNTAGTPFKFISIAVTAEGQVYMLDANSKTVIVFNQSGVVTDRIKKITTTTGSITLSDPTAICVDSQNQLYIYDDNLGKIIKKPAKGNAIVFGDKGSGLGNIKDVISMAADSKGYCYTLNGSSGKVDIFYPEGGYLTWISGANAAFKKAKAIGINGADELYVLDTEGPTVYMFGVSGALINTKSLVSSKNLLMTKPSGMAVLANGDFLLMDEESSQATQFNRYGAVVGTVGAMGSSKGNGIFGHATLISGSTATYDDKICILDEKSQQVQLFEVKTTSPAMKSPPRRLKMVNSSSTRKPVYDLTVAPNGFRYVIPYEDHKKVIAYKDTSEVDIFTITGKIEDAVCVVADSSSNLIVVDRGADEVLMFDLSGTLIRKFGKELADKLRDPIGAVVQKSGNIIVADRSRSSLYMWNGQGVFKKIITSPENSVMTSPARIQCDSKDQLYVWDDDANCIYRLGSGGWPTSEKKLHARSLLPGEKPGVISDFYIDPLDQIHLFNETSHQIEVYTWDFEPVLKFSMGRPGEGSNALNDIDRMLLDTRTLNIYFTHRKGETQQVYQYMVTPPKPEGTVNFDVIDGKLQVYFSKIKSSAVVGYGLVTPTPRGDSVVYRTTSSFISISQKPEDSKLYHYDLVSLSLNDHSEPSVGFDDYFSYAESMIFAQKYDEALGAWQLALEKMGRPMRMAEYVAARLSEVSEELIKNYDLITALAYMKTAFALNQKSPIVIENYGKALKAQYRQFANRGDIEAIISDVDSYLKNASLKEVAIRTADTVSRVLALEENLTSISHAIRLQKKLAEWDKGNPQIMGSLAASYYELFKFKSIRETSMLELNTILEEAVTNGKIAYTGLKSGGKPYFESHVVLLASLNESGKYEEVQKQASAELGSSASLMTQPVMVSYRQELARAFSGMGQHNMAEAEYNTILSITPGDRQISELLAGELIAEKKYTAAKNIIQQLMLGTSDNASLMARTGYIELLNGNYNEAVFQLEKAINQSPSLRSSYGYLAEAYEKTSNNTKALDNYEVAIQYLDEMITKVGKRNITQGELGSLPERREGYLMASAKICEESNDYASAREHYLRITELNPSNGSAWFGLGSACRNTGRIYDAMAAFNSALAQDENNNAYISAYVNAVKLRDNSLKNENPLHVIDVQVKNVFPSLFKNYSDLRQLPVGAITIANNTADPITPTSVTVFVSELMSQPTQVNAPIINGFSNTEVKLAALFPESVLDNKDTRNLQMNVEVTYVYNGKTLTEKKSSTFVLNGRNAIIWSDKRRLASFVSPNEEKLIEYNKRADVIFRNAPTFGQNKTLLKALQLYTLLNKSGLSYSNDPAQSYSKLSVHTDIIDYLQYPTETLKRKGGDCDDLVALFAALLENSGVSAAYIDLPGHVMAAFDAKIKPQDITNAGLSMDEVIIIGENVWIPIEATLLGSKNFFSAWKAGAERFNLELKRGNFPDLIPFADAWSIYKPSSYIAAGYSEEPPSGAEIIKHYDVLVSQLVAKTKHEAIKEMSSRYQSEPENAYVKNVYGTLLAQTGETVAARKIFEEALKINSENASVLNNLGNTYLFEAKYGDAIKYYEQASIFDDRDPNILINLCRAYLLKGDKGSAKSSFDKAVAIDPEFAELYTDLKTQLK